MNYRDEIRPWAIFQYLPSGENVCVARLRTRPDADAYASLLRQGGGSYQVLFDVQPQEVTQG
ncbi:hypothetical protein I8752_29120 [Nostocaceae cyanobacterium CENA369]|uniref:Uncharacterized protein n=1 Tax=Dendronalium phyllosphericum CENA369 TaxID=1725256 RepID=A0A8J7LIF1_9NOST|nr:hypothetical protein [Dendronalium phyllosphericum]MBH8576973.1 hypothetical protein [Dendronalium phyllosphericum CENA369]